SASKVKKLSVDWPAGVVTICLGDTKDIRFRGSGADDE
ncbi:hypothetical protein EVA_14907, partial [gut metagenome]